MKISTLANKFDTDPESDEFEFSEMAAVLRELADQDKDTAALWSPAVMEGGKTEGHTREVTALALDFDHAEPPWDRLGAWNYFAHTTHSHTAADPHWRVVVELEGPVPAAQWKQLFKAKCAMHELPCDPKCCNPNRAFFVPPPGAEWRQNVGTPATMPTFCPDEKLNLSDQEPRPLETDGQAFWSAIEFDMRTMRPSIDGHGGHADLLAAACVLRRGYALTPEACMEALRVFNARCEPPWSESELAHKVSEAGRASMKDPPIGSRVPAAKIEPSQDWEEAQVGVLEIRTIDYLCKELGLRPGRPSLWTADAGCGKSTLAASVALAAASGSSLWGAINIRACDVCYVAGEDAEGVLRNWKRLCLAQGTRVPVGLRISRAVQLAGPRADTQQILRIVTAHRLVIFDTLRSLTRESGVEENDTGFSKPLYDLADILAHAPQCCAMVLHHNNKQGKSNGTAALFGAAGNRLVLTREPGTLITNVTAEATRDGLSIRPFTVTANLAACPAPADDHDSPGIALKYSLAVAPVHANQTKARDRIVDRLREYSITAPDRWWPRSEVIADLGMKNDDVSAALQAAVDTGRVAREARGKSNYYRFVPVA